MVIQCKASNDQGYALANGYINVFGLNFCRSVFALLLQLLSVKLLSLTLTQNPKPNPNPTKPY